MWDVCAAVRRLIYYPNHWSLQCTRCVVMIAMLSLLLQLLALMQLFAMITFTSTSAGTDVCPHVPILLRAIYCNGRCAWPARWTIRRPILGFLGSKVYKMGDSLPGTQMNRRAQFDDASCILGGEIRNHTKITNKQRHKHHISTLCLSACVDNNNNDA